MADIESLTGSSLAPDPSDGEAYRASAFSSTREVEAVAACLDERAGDAGD
ncbi:hypothetical protein [Halocalculus aciditolerans]|nr:hypothetical protein [Halocalculus aciditolerans]